MPGLIKREDIDELRARTDIKAVVEQYVTLKSAGIGSFKGLCPFHDERSPSFNVRPQVGQFHCFGCGEGGDVIAFLQKIDQLSFTEAVEQLAARIGFELHYEDGGSGPRKEDSSRRQRLLDAHKVAAEFYAEELGSPQAVIGRQFLSGRGFGKDSAEQFSIGFAPQGWDSLLKHLRGRKFSDAELSQTGMFSTGSSGSRLFDRFRGRLIWPIRNASGETIGFGARRLFDEDQGPKYLNTPETALYKKSQVLYGIDLARREISKNKQLVVVEGYTDVMACHLSGVTAAVATCGTAFGEEHVKVARRFLADDGSGEVVFTFDGDAAGQKAALKAFSLDQRFTSQTFVAVEPSGQDPCELRQSGGPEAVKALISTKRPLFEFAIRSTLDQYNLDTVEGRVQGLRAAAPVLAEIRDPSTRVGYSQEVAGWLGVQDPNEVLRAVNSAIKYQRSHPKSAPSAQAGATAPGAQAQQQAQQQEGSTPAPAYVAPDPRDPAARMERSALEAIVQQPMLLSSTDWQELADVELAVPAYRALKDALVAVGPPSGPPKQWLGSIMDHTPAPLHPLLSQLVVASLPASNAESLRNYCAAMLRGLFELQINRLKAQKLGALQRMDPATHAEQYHQLQQELMALEVRRRALRNE